MLGSRVPSAFTPLSPCRKRSPRIHVFVVSDFATDATGCVVVVVTCQRPRQRSSTFRAAATSTAVALLGCAMAAGVHGQIRAASAQLCQNGEHIPRHFAGSRISPPPTRCDTTPGRYNRPAGDVKCGHILTPCRRSVGEPGQAARGGRRPKSAALCCGRAISGSDPPAIPSPQRHHPACRALRRRPAALRV